MSDNSDRKQDGSSGSGKPGEQEPFVETYLRLAREGNNKKQQVLPKVGPADVERLIEALNDRHAGVKQAAAEALGQIGDPRAVEPLAALLNGYKDAKDVAAGMRVVDAVQEALEEINDPRAVAAIAVSLGHKEDYIRTVAEILIGRLLPLADEKIREEALASTRQAGNAQAEKVLTTLMRKRSMNIYHILRKPVRDVFRKHPALKALQRRSASIFWVLMGIAAIVIVIGFFASPFKSNLIWAQIDSVAITIVALAMPIFRAYRIFQPAPEDEFQYLTPGIATAVSIGFFGFFLYWLGPIGVPGLLTYINQMICPAGFELGNSVTTRNWDLPGVVFTVSQQPVCTIGNATFSPGKGLQVAAGMPLFLLYSGIILSVAHLVKMALLKKPLFALRPYYAFFISVALIIPLQFATVLNTSFRGAISPRINDLIFRGHAVALVEAVKRHNSGLVSNLLARGGDINAQDHNGETALGVAQRFNDKEVLAMFSGRITGGSETKKALLDKGIVYDEANFLKQVEAGNIENVKQFLDAGMDINAVGSSESAYGNTALSLAVKNNHKELVQLLLDKKADVNKRGETGWTPLQAAAVYGRVDMVRLLIARGAAIEARDNADKTPLMLARDLETVKVLVEHNADVNARHSRGYSALLFAIESNNDETRPELVAYLLEHGADPNVNLYDTGQTALRMARFQRDKKVIEMLEQRHARE